MSTGNSSLFLEIDIDDSHLRHYSSQNFSPQSSPTKKQNIYNINNTCDDDVEVLSLTKEMEILNDSITKHCTIREEDKVGSGSSAGIYTMSGNPNLYVKISNLPYESYMLSKSGQAGIACETIKDKLNVSIREIDNSLKYEKLSYAFPHNIMRIESAERCKKIYNGSPFFANKFLIEKINGVTLDMAIETMSEQELLYCVLQLVYILSYANLHGFFHNDITCNNIMIYYGEVDTVTFNKLFLLDDIIICRIHTNNTTTKLPLVKLIDFSYSEYINYSVIPEMLNSVVVGEPQQILTMINNKLNRIASPLQHSTIFQQIYSSFDVINTANPLLKFRFSELEEQISNVGFRTLSNDEIIDMSIPKTFAENTLLKCFNIIKNIPNINQYGIYVNITNKQTHILPGVRKSPFKTKNKQIKQIKQIEEYTLPEIQDKYIHYAVKTNKLLNAFYEGSIKQYFKN